MKRFLKRYALWLLYAVFLACALVFGSREGLVSTHSPYSTSKYVLFSVFVCFLVYSVYATRRENFFRTLGTMTRLYWGRQIGLDLYISVFLSLALIYLVEGSAIILVLWFVPIFVFANLAILPYLLLNFAEVIGHF